MPEDSFFSRDQVEAIAERAFAISKADEVRINIESHLTGNTRFAGNQATTGADMHEVSASVTSAFGSRVASATTDDPGGRGLEAAISTSEQLATLVPESANYLGELSPQEYLEADALFQSTLDLSADARAEAIRPIVEAAEEEGLIASGFLTHQSGARAVVNTRGLFAYHTRSAASLTTTVRTRDGTGSGRAGFSANDWNRMASPAEIGRAAMETAVASRNPSAVEPGYWTVILEPAAAVDFVSRIMGALNARAAAGGGTFFSAPGPEGGTRIGDQVVDERLSIFSTPDDERILGSPFNAQGLPNRHMSWIEEGVLKNMVVDRGWARAQGQEPSGWVSGYFVTGGRHTVQEMIETTERGILVSRFWYIRVVDSRTLLFTGLTRDGLFLVENGRVVRPVKNMRWNESPGRVLNNIEMLGVPTRVPTGTGPGVWVPPMKVRDFRFTTISDAI